MSIDKNYLNKAKEIQKDIDNILTTYPFPDSPKYLYDPIKYVCLLYTSPSPRDS